MSSNFDGYYYSETCKPGKKKKKINQKRPYYVIIFGNTQNINKALDSIVIKDELPGYKESARFSLTKNIKTSYKVTPLNSTKKSEIAISNIENDLYIEEAYKMLEK